MAKKEKMKAEYGKMCICKKCKDFLQKMIDEEAEGLRDANKEHSVIMGTYYASRLGLLIDLVRGTITRPEETLKLQLQKQLDEYFDYEKLTCLRTKDGLRIYYFNEDRKRHIVVNPEQMWGTNLTYKTEEYRELKITYKQWKNRWCK